MHPLSLSGKDISLFVFYPVMPKGIFQGENGICDNFDFVFAAICYQVRKPIVQGVSGALCFHCKHFIRLTVQQIHQLYQQLCTGNCCTRFDVADVRNAHINHGSHLLLGKILVEPRSPQTCTNISTWG